MKTHNCEQGSDEWLQLRAGVVTASEADALVSPTFKQRDSKGVESYLAKKLAEKWLGGPLPSDAIQTMPMEFGSILEQEARPFFTFATGKEVQTVGFITDEAGRCGCSPDGLLGDDAGLEIKCPAPNTHLRYLLDGVLPADYAVQVHFSMFITGRPQWVFMSYRRGMPPFILTVQRDDAIQATIKAAVDAFLKRLDESWAKLVALNGGQEPERNLFRELASNPTSSFDVVP